MKDKDINQRNISNLKDFQIEKELSSYDDYIKVFKVLRKIDNKHYILLKYPLNFVTNNVNNFQKLENILENIKILLKKIKNDNILNIKESFIEKPKSSVIMILELYDNLTIQNSLIKKYKLMRDKYIPENILLNYLHNIIEALSVLHKNNIFNINLSPNNIYINDNNLKLNPYISLENLSSSKKCNNSYFKIKAPELLKNAPDNNYTPKTDIWYMGLLIYEISQLKPINKDYLYNENENNNIYNYIIKCHYSCNNYYSNNIKEIIKLCLQYSQNKRPSSIELLKIIEIYRQNNILNSKLNSTKKASELKRKINLKDKILKINHTLAKIKNYDDSKPYIMRREFTPVITRKNSNYFKVNQKKIFFGNKEFNNQNFKKPRLTLKTSFINNYNNNININTRKTGKKFFGIHKNNETLKGYLKIKPFNLQNFESENPYYFLYKKNKTHNNFLKIKQRSPSWLNNFENISLKKEKQYRKINKFFIKKANYNYNIKNYKRSNSINFRTINKTFFKGK